MKAKSILCAAAAMALALACAGCAANRGFRSETCAFAGTGITLHMELPMRLKLSGKPAIHFSGFSAIFGDPAKDPELLGGSAVMQNGETVGFVSLYSLEGVPEADLAYFLEDPTGENRQLALYQGHMPIGSMVHEAGYVPVWTAEDGTQGAATGLLLYRGDYLESIADQNGRFDISRLGEAAGYVGYLESMGSRDYSRPAPGEREEYATKCVWAYNLALQRFVMIQLVYDALSFDELALVAQSVRLA